MKVDIIIYSKNRASQLDMLLRSIKHNFLNVNDVFVLNDFDSEIHYNSYKKIWGKNYGFNTIFKTQTRDIFYDVVLSSLNEVKTDYVLPFCDDDLFIKKTDITDDVQYITDDVVGLCFRRAPNLTTSYHTGEVIPLPKFEKLGNVFKWKWLNENPYRWGYPYQAGGLLYNKQFFHYMMKNITFNIPNHLESGMMDNKHKWGKEHVLCREFSPIVNVSVNRVQDVYVNRGGRDVNYSVSDLAEKFLAGNIIDIMPLQDMVNVCEFVEIPLSFINEDDL